MDIHIPLSTLLNLDAVIKRQNEQLIRAICRWKGWNSNQMISEFLSDKANFNQINENINALEELKSNMLNSKPDNSKPDNSKPDNSKQIEVRVRQNWNYEGINYLLETSSDNVYTLSGTFVGKKFNNLIDFDAEED